MPVDAPSEIRLGRPIDLHQRIQLILDGEVDAQEPTPSLDVLEERWGQRIAPRAEDDCDAFCVRGRCQGTSVSAPQGIERPLLAVSSAGPRGWTRDPVKTPTSTRFSLSQEMSGTSLQPVRQRTLRRRKSRPGRARSTFIVSRPVPVPGRWAGSTSRRAGAGKEA
jgi:hypothetical protein